MHSEVIVQDPHAADELVNEGSSKQQHRALQVCGMCLEINAIQGEQDGSHWGRYTPLGHHTSSALQPSVLSKCNWHSTWTLALGHWHFPYPVPRLHPVRCQRQLTWIGAVFDRSWFEVRLCFRCTTPHMICCVPLVTTDTAATARPRGLMDMSVTVLCAENEQEYWSGGVGFNHASGYAMRKV